METSDKIALILKTRIQIILILKADDNNITNLETYQVLKKVRGNIF